MTKDREPLFGEIVDGEMRLSAMGEVVRDEWLNTPSIRPEIELGEFVIMPDHFHAIVIINESDVGAYGNQRVGAYGHTPLLQDPQPIQQNTGFRSPSRTIGALVRGFKGAVTKRINEMRDTPGFPVWQRNYHDRVIRSDEEYRGIEWYIANNPANGEDEIK